MEGGFLPEVEPTEPSGRWAPGAAPLPRPPTAGWAAPVVEEQPPEEGCSSCPSLSYNDEFLRAFGVALCNSCKRNEPLISKSSAKQKYSLTDNDLRTLGSVRRQNAQNKNWQPMCLYLLSQVERVARQKFGSLEEMEERHRQKLDALLEARLREREKDKLRDEQKEERYKRIKQRIQAERQGPELQVTAGAEVEEI